VLLPLTLQLTDKKGLSLSGAIATVTSHPATIAGLEAGTLSPGVIADICIFDPDQIWTVERDQLKSAGKNTPFPGWEMTGKVTHTLLGGQLVYEQ
jgi:dihydroorotase